MMNKFTVDDLLYGFHFAFKSYLPIVNIPLSAVIRIESDDILDNSTHSNCYGKEYRFTVHKDGQGLAQIYFVDAQLPWCVCTDLCTENKKIYIRISDGLNDVILDVEINTFWLRVQKQKLLQKNDVDKIKCGMYNATQMDKINFQKEKHTSLLWIRRLGSRVGNSDKDNGQLNGLLDYQLILFDKEFEDYKKWLFRYTPFVEFAFLAGHTFMPITALLCLADTSDEWSFSHEGWTKMCSSSPLWIQSWRKDWNDTSLFVSNLHTKQNTFWQTVDLMCCNTSSTKKQMHSSKILLFPQLNSTMRNPLDRQASSMFVLDMLYKLTNICSVSFLTVEKLRTHWPCICIGIEQSVSMTGSLVDCYNNELKFYHGLVKRQLLNNIVRNKSLPEKTVLRLICDQSNNESNTWDKKKEEIKKTKLLLLCWRDYENNVLCSALLYHPHNPQHLGVDVSRNLTRQRILLEHGLNAKVHIQKYVTVQQSFMHAFKTNAPRTLRNVLNINNILLFEKVLKNTKSIYSWHLGYLIETKSRWAKNHVVSVFDVPRIISM